jgi:Tol biopolymer transport system component
LLDLQGGDIRPLTTGTGQESEPALSPDGRQIALTSGREDLDLIEVALDGSFVRPLRATSRNEQSGAWLPSGSEYALITNQTGTEEVWLRRAGETWARPILAEHAEGVPPWYLLYCLRVSPDGQYVSYDVLSKEHWVWVSPISGGRPSPLDTESTDQHAASWSPEGKRIAYRRLNGSKFELAVTAVGGGMSISLGETAPGGYMRGGVTEWSPTGEWICHNSPKGLELVSPDGKKRRLVTSIPYRAFVFTGDGTGLIVLRRSARRRWELATLSVTDGRERSVVEVAVAPGVALLEMTRHPDGKRLLITVSMSRQDIWLMAGFQEPRSWWWTPSPRRH